MLQTGEVLLDRYVIDGVVGKGGMSTVYRAKDRVSGKTLAVKEVARTGKEENQTVEQSLAAEGRMLKGFSNPHLPKIYDIIEQPDRFMLVMDFIRGESLDKVIAKEGAQSVDRVLDWGMQICQVLDYLHSQQTPIIYRDMKPANVMLQPDGLLMLIDFGTARVQKVGVEMSADTVCIGTAGFAAPEQYGGFGQSTARTDIFCLGATLYNMITGHSPCEKPVGIYPLGQWNPALANTPIAEIIAKCTRNDPDERYQTAMELYEDLRRAGDGTYRTAKKGTSGSLWQSSHGKGMITTGLSGLLQKNRLTVSQRADEKTTSFTRQSTSEVCSSGWQAASTQGVIQQAENRTTQRGSGLDKRSIILIAALTTVIFVVMTIVLAVLGIQGAAIVFFLIAMLSAAAAVVAMLLPDR